MISPITNVVIVYSYNCFKKLSHWCDNNKLLHNIPKYTVMSYHRPQKPTDYTYKIKGAKLIRRFQRNILELLSTTNSGSVNILLKLCLVHWKQWVSYWEIVNLLTIHWPSHYYILHLFVLNLNAAQLYGIQSITITSPCNVCGENLWNFSNLNVQENIHLGI